jgi:hypothetical protein
MMERDFEEALFQGEVALREPIVFVTVADKHFAFLHPIRDGIQLTLFFIPCTGPQKRIQFFKLGYPDH